MLGLLGKNGAPQKEKGSYLFYSHSLLHRNSYIAKCVQIVCNVIVKNKESNSFFFSPDEKLVKRWGCKNCLKSIRVAVLIFQVCNFLRKEKGAAKKEYKRGYNNIHIEIMQAV